MFSNILNSILLIHGRAMDRRQKKARDNVIKYAARLHCRNYYMQMRKVSRDTKQISGWIWQRSDDALILKFGVVHDSIQSVCSGPIKWPKFCSPVAAIKLVNDSFSGHVVLTRLFSLIFAQSRLLAGRHNAHIYTWCKPVYTGLSASVDPTLGAKMKELKTNCFSRKYFHFFLTLNVSTLPSLRLRACDCSLPAYTRTHMWEYQRDRSAGPVRNATEPHNRKVYVRRVKTCRTERDLVSVGKRGIDIR